MILILLRQVYIGSSEFLPTLDMSPHHSWTRRISRLSFEAKETYTTEECRQLSIQQRKCVFADEIALVTDDKFTYSACMRQCRMEMAHTLCGCVPFFYPLPVRQLKGYKCTNARLHHTFTFLLTFPFSRIVL